MLPKLSAPGDAMAHRGPEVVPFGPAAGEPAGWMAAVRDGGDRAVTFLDMRAIAH